jgi:hypothetical protein
MADLNFEFSITNIFAYTGLALVYKMVNIYCFLHVLLYNSIHFKLAVPCFSGTALLITVLACINQL